MKLKRFIITLRRIRRLFFKFPLPPKQNGYYPIVYTKTGSIACPYDGHSCWSVYGMVHIECNYCHRHFKNYGIEVGLELYEQYNKKR